MILLTSAVVGVRIYASVGKTASSISTSATET